MAKPPLKLRGIDPQDVAILSAALQNATTRVADMAFLPKQRTFAIMLDRHRWECDEEGADCGPHLRVRTGLHFNDVEKVSQQGIDLADRDASLELLFVTATPCDEAPLDCPAAEIDLMFEGGAIIRLTAGCIDCTLMDVGDAWVGEDPDTAE